MRSFFSLPLLALLPLVVARSHKRASCALHHPSPPSSTSHPQPSGLVSAAWYAGWHSDDYPLSSVSWNKLTHITYAFAIPTSDVNTLSLADSDQTLLPTFVSTAHKNNVKALVSVGGWTGSIYYSPAVATQENRTAFVKTITDFATKYSLDGIDFDWEYPGNQGIGCNIVNPQDTTNFLDFLTLLRQHPVGKHLILTAATSIFPWHGPDGNPLTDVSAFASNLDWVALMNYDVWGSWSPSVGPNAPLKDDCAAPENQQGSAASGVAKWYAAGMPKNKIVLGVASYGHSFHVTKSNAISPNGQFNSYPSFDATQQPIGDKWDDDGGVDACGATSGPGGNFDFWGLVDNGFLSPNGTAAHGIDYRFDTCSQTAYVYNEQTQVMVSFDDSRAFAAKGSFIKAEGLRGWATWEAGGDYKDILLDSIRAAAGAN